ncbi:siderophore-interacting protein [Pseudomonas aeruginosa]
MPPFRRLQRVRHEPKKRDVTVIRRRLISPQFLSLTFSGEDLNSFISDGFDDHIKFMFTESNGNAIRRDYTPRHFDANALELTIEFALHGNGLACEWAQRAEVGSRAQIGGPRGSMIVPLDFDWQSFHCRRLRDAGRTQTAGGATRRNASNSDADCRRCRPPLLYHCS